MEGGGLDAAGSPPEPPGNAQLISRRLRELLQVVQLLLHFELRDCCGCCTFGDLPSFSLQESIWKQEKKKKERERGREGDSIVFCTYLQTCLTLSTANPTGRFIPME